MQSRCCVAGVAPQATEKLGRVGTMMMAEPEDLSILFFIIYERWIRKSPEPADSRSVPSLRFGYSVLPCQEKEKVAGRLLGPEELLRYVRSIFLPKLALILVERENTFMTPLVSYI